MYLSDLVKKKSRSTNTRSATDDLFHHSVEIVPTLSLKDLLTLQRLLSGID